MGNTLRERKTYQDFVSYTSARAPPASRLNLDAPGDSAADPEEQAMRLGINAAAMVEEALTYFGCRDEWYMIAGSVQAKKVEGKVERKACGADYRVQRDCHLRHYHRCETNSFRGRIDIDGVGGDL